MKLPRRVRTSPSIGHNHCRSLGNLLTIIIKIFIEQRPQRLIYLVAGDGVEPPTGAYETPEIPFL